MISPSPRVVGLAGFACVAIAAAPARAQEWLELRDQPPTRVVDLLDAARDKGAAAEGGVVLALTLTQNDGVSSPRPFVERVGSTMAFVLSSRRWVAIKTDTGYGIHTGSLPLQAADVSGAHRLWGRFALTSKESRGDPTVELWARAGVRHASRLDGFLLDSQFGRRAFWDAGASLGIFAGGSFDRSASAGIEAWVGYRAAGYSAVPLGHSFEGKFEEIWTALGGGFLPKDGRDVTMGMADPARVEFHRFGFDPASPAAHARPMNRLDFLAFRSQDVILPLRRGHRIGISTALGYSYLWDGVIEAHTPVFTLGVDYSSFRAGIDGSVGGALVREVVPLADGSKPMARTRLEGSIRAVFQKMQIGFMGKHAIEHRQAWTPGGAKDDDRGFVYAVAAEMFALPMKEIVEVGLVYTVGNGCPMAPIEGNGGSCQSFGGFLRAHADSRGRAR